MKASCTSILDIDTKTADAAQNRAWLLEILSRRLLVCHDFALAKGTHKRFSVATNGEQPGIARLSR